MARVALTVNSVASVAGVDLTGNETQGTADDMEFLNTGNEFISVRNADATAARDITVVANGTGRFGEDYSDEVVSVTATETVIIGPFPRAAFNTSASKVELDLDAGNEADLYVAAFKFSPAS